MNFYLQGSGVALITPFDGQGAIEHKELQAMVEFMVDGGIDFIVALGTTAETPALSKRDREAVLETLKSSLNGRIPLVLGMGGNDTHELLEHIKSFNLGGVDALLSVTPYYNRPSQEGLYRHYAQVADATDLPIILYNVPFRTGCNLTAETTLRLASDFSNIVGTKEASGDFGQITEILRNRPAGFKVYSGDDLLSLPFISLGADGVISVVANAFPKTFSEMIKKALAGNHEEALVLHEQLLPVVKHIFQEGSPAGVKAILSQRGMIQPHLRLPLIEISEKLKAVLAEIDERWVGPK
jgi:4-hydroxy-tetrahydrodipicolinate synthase